MNKKFLDSLIGKSTDEAAALVFYVDDNYGVSALEQDSVRVAMIIDHAIILYRDENDIVTRVELGNPNELEENE